MVKLAPVLKYDVTELAAPPLLRHLQRCETTRLITTNQMHSYSHRDIHDDSSLCVPGVYPRVDISLPRFKSHHQRLVAETDERRIEAQRVASYQLVMNPSYEKTAYSMTRNEL